MRTVILLVALVIAVGLFIRSNKSMNAFYRQDFLTKGDWCKVHVGEEVVEMEFRGYDEEKGLILLRDKTGQGYVVDEVMFEKILIK